MSEPDDPFSDPGWLEFAERARTDLVPKLDASVASLSLVPTGETDIKFAVELGLSIMMDKPIIALVRPGQRVPDKIVRVSDAIVEFTPDDPDFARRLKAVLDRVLGHRGSEQ